MKKVRLRPIHILSWNNIWDDGNIYQLGVFTTDEEAVAKQEEHMEYVMSEDEEMTDKNILSNLYQIEFTILLDDNRSDLTEEYETYYKNKFSNERPDEYEFIESFGTSYSEKTEFIRVVTEVPKFGQCIDPAVQDYLNDGWEILRTHMLEPNDHNYPNFYAITELIKHA